MSTPAVFNDTFADYLQRISSGLKDMGTEQRNDVLREIRSHLTERAEQFRQQGSSQPELDAIRALGDSRTIALQFSLEALEQKANRSFRPWVLLRAAWYAAILGVRGVIAFLIGLIGYSIAVGSLIAPLIKFFIPQSGMWISPHGFLLAGVPRDPASAHELAGANYAYVMVLFAFLAGTATTFLLRRLLRSWKVPKGALGAGVATFT